jgi:prophage regulatory protein
VNVSRCGDRGVFETAGRAWYRRRMGRPREKGDDVVRGERFRQRGGTKSWGAREWGAYVRGYQSGQGIGRQDGLKAQPPRDERLLRVHEEMNLTGLGRTTIWQLERDGEFPKRRKRAGSRGRAVGWWASDIARWIAERAAARTA